MVEQEQDGHQHHPAPHHQEHHAAPAAHEDVNKMPPEPKSDPRNDFLIPASILLAGIMISGSVFFSLRQPGVVKGGVPQADVPSPTPAPTAPAGGDVPQITDKDIVFGDAKAAVSVIEYGDYQCPYCSRFHEQVVVPLRGEYIKDGTVKFAFRDFQFLGPESTTAAEAARCARDQEKFWQYHDALYGVEAKDGRENNGNLNKNLFVSIAKNLQMDVAAFTKCFDSHQYQKVVQQDTAEAQAVGVNSTPTSFVNGQKIPGALPYPQFKALIEAQLKANNS